MKNIKYYVLSVALVLAIVTAGTLAIFDMNSATRRYCNAGVYDMLNPSLIELYESEIFGEEVLSGKSQAQLERAANKLGISVEKLKAITLLQDFAAMTGRNVSLTDLAEMNDVKLIGYFKQCADDYLKTITPERRSELEQKLKRAMKGA